MKNSKKILKNKSINVIIAIIFIVVSIGLFSCSLYLANNKPKEEAKENYNELIAKGEDTKEKYVEITIASMPYEVAEKEEKFVSKKYYIILDEDNYMYLARLSDDTYNKIKKMYEEKSDNFSYILTGYIYETPKELKDITIEVYNKAQGEEIINLENFKDYFGSTYLDETMSPYTTVSGLLIGIGILVLILGILFMVTYIVSTVNLRKLLKRYGREEIIAELEKNTTAEYKKEKIYLTDKYIISNFNGLKVIGYKDLIWAYHETRKYNGIIVGKFLVAYTNSFKSLRLSASVKNEEVLLEIMNKIKEKNPDIMLGFTDENKNKFKVKKKKQKNDL